MFKGIVAAVFALLSLPAHADGIPTTVSGLRGVLIHSIFEVTSFEIPAGDLHSCVTRTAGADWTLYGCDTALPLVSDAAGGTQYIVFDRAIIIKSGTNYEYQFMGSWRSAPNDLLLGEPVLLLLRKEGRAEQLTGTFSFKNLDYSIAAKAVFQ